MVTSPRAPGTAPRQDSPAVPASKGARAPRAPARRDDLQPGPSTGVRMAKQSRSRRTQQALLAAGHALLREHDLSALTVAQVAAAAGVAVGSFYARFEDKHAWFSELAREASAQALTELTDLLASPAMRAADVPQRARLLIGLLVQVHRDNAGLYRAAMSEPARVPRYFGPLHRLHQQVVDQADGLLAPGLLPAERLLRRPRLDLAFQMVFGTLVQAALYDAGPMRLHDPALPDALTGAVLAMLEAPMGAAAAAATGLPAPGERAPAASDGTPAAA